MVIILVLPVFKTLDFVYELFYVETSTVYNTLMSSKGLGTSSNNLQIHTISRMIVMTRCISDVIRLRYVDKKELLGLNIKGDRVEQNLLIHNFVFLVLISDK